MNLVTILLLSEILFFCTSPVGATMEKSPQPKKETTTCENGITLFMNSDKPLLTIQDPVPGQLKDVEKVIYRGNDYTHFFKEASANQSLAFASDKFLIFSGEKVVLNAKNGIWTCPKGIAFIPGKAEVLVITASNITFNQKKQSFHAVDATVKTISIDSGAGRGSKEPKISIQKEFSLNLGQWD